MPPSRDDATSSEMRHDWLTDRWVIMAPQRTARPIEFVRQPTQVLANDNCPFCRGHESQTPEAVACYYPHGQHPASPRWHVRVVPNKFPAVTQATQPNLVAAESLASIGLGENLIQHETISRAESIQWVESGSFAKSDSANNSLKLFKRHDVSGGHEVIIEGPNHVQSLSQLDRETVKLVFQAYRDRLHYWLTEQSIAYAVVFKNVGQEAGASLVHSHSQLISTDLVPTDVTRAAQRMDLFYEQEGECLFCRTVQDELQQQVRLVEETTDYIAYCPFASRLPSLVTITSKHHVDQFESLPDKQLEQLSWLIHRLVGRIEHCFPDAAYNYVIHTAPLRHQGSPSFHWRLELFPRISTQAGFEWGSECFINPLPPEVAARNLRSASL
jgi:UDPglucose--hexose-1-phosphate uridylyltransferase